MTTISPTIGRVVWFFPDESPQRHLTLLDRTTPLDGHIVYVHSETSVNLVVFDHEGRSHPYLSVPINTGQTTGMRAEWMPYQQKMAEKHKDE